MKHTRWWLIGLALALIMSSIFSSVVFSIRAISFLKQGQLTQADHFAGKALPVVRILNALTFQLVPDLRVWSQGLIIVTQADEVQTELQQYLQAIFATEPVHANSSPFPSLIPTLSTQLTDLTQTWQKTWVLQHVVSEATNNKLTTVANSVADFQPVHAALLSGEHTYLILFQNTHELRATGGFMGSYAQVTLKDGVLTELSIHDIYEPDGQFTGFVEAPPGVREYLSGGKGWRLPDANWHPDFGVAAPHILSYFALGKTQGIEGLVALNLELAEQILLVTGPIYLSDYNLTVTADNLAEVARADRDEFFAGSYQKPQFLKALLTQLRFKMSELDDSQKQAIIGILLESFSTKNVQIYSTNADIKKFIDTYQLGGTLKKVADYPVIALIESNVGINKANKNATREVSIQHNAYRTTVITTFHNQNTATDLNYVNYQRVIVPVEFTVHSLTIDGKILSQWDEDVTTNSAGDSFKQIGFLVVTSSQKSNTFTLELTHPEQLTKGLHIHKQPGVPPTPYTVVSEQESFQFVLEQDQLVKW